jgi:hypothetical protein
VSSGTFKPEEVGDFGLKKEERWTSGMRKERTDQLLQEGREEASCIETNNDSGSRERRTDIKSRIDGLSRRDELLFEISQAVFFVEASSGTSER